MSLAETVAAHQRLCILRLLSAAPGYKLNDSAIMGGLDSFGLAASRDGLRATLAWLDEQGLLTLASPVETVLVARLSERGADVAEGRAHHPGVHRPSPASLARGALRAAAGLKPEE